VLHPFTFVLRGNTVYRRTQAPVYSKALLDAMLGTLGARPAAALFDTPVVQLFTAGPAITPTTDPTAYTEAAFHGYVADAPTFAAVGNLIGGDQGLPAQVHFAATSGGSLGAETIIGYLLTGASDAFYMGEFFAQPVPIAAVGDFLDLDIILPLLVRPSFSV
jgi:hypothetical protein